MNLTFHSWPAASYRKFNDVTINMRVCVPVLVRACVRMCVIYRLAHEMSYH